MDCPQLALSLELNLLTLKKRLCYVCNCKLLEVSFEVWQARLKTRKEIYDPLRGDVGGFCVQLR